MQALHTVGLVEKCRNTAIDDLNNANDLLSTACNVTGPAIVAVSNSCCNSD